MAKSTNLFFTAVILAIVILLFTIIDYVAHSLNGAWSVPDYYFRNKIIFGLFWVAIGFFIAGRFKNFWLKSLIFAGIISVALQFRYFIEGYSLDFVFIFLVIHFLILYFLSMIMYRILK